MRLIDADAFIQMMEEKCDPESTLDPWVLSVCRGGVKMMPTVDAVPVRHGRWREDTGVYGFWICSHCGFVSEASAANLLYRYCPMCGARMDGKGDGNG